MELYNQRNSACYMPSMDGMRVAVYLLHLMHVLYFWAVAHCCACFAAADSGPNAALYAVVAWTPAASVFPAPRTCCPSHIYLRTLNLPFSSLLLLRCAVCFSSLHFACTWVLAFTRACFTCSSNTQVQVTTTPSLSLSLRLTCFSFLAPASRLLRSRPSRWSWLY